MDCRFFYLTEKCEVIDLKSYLYDCELQKIELFGMGYVINHCITLFKKDYEKKLNEQYKDFYCKSLGYLAQGFGLLTNYLTQQEAMTSFADFISEKPEDTRTAEEVATDVLKKCGFIRG